MIKRVFIQNFRSIKELEIFPTSLCALVGPNSTGKTNILKAIDLVLGEGWATKATVARRLFYDEREPIWIEIDLKQDIAYQSFKGVIDVNKVTLKMSLNPDLNCEVRVWSNYPEDNYGKGFFVNDEFKKDCHFIYIPSNRDLIDEMKVSNWTLLGKMMKTIYENYVAFYGGDQSKLKLDFAELMMPPKDFLEKDFTEDGITFKKFVETFDKYCTINSAGLAKNFNPQLNIYNLNWFYKTLQIAVKEDGVEKLFDSEEVGAGMQNLILISIFQTYAELMKGKVVMAIEEPELYLYPQAQRGLYKTFIKLSEDSQIFYTTHNQNLVDAGRAYEVQMLQRSKDLGTFVLKKDRFVTPDAAEKLKHKIYTHFNTERNEIFFAKKILLVEGSSDKILWTTLSEEKWDIDLEKEGVSIIECGGKGGVVYFAGFCRLMGIKHYFAVWDKDDDQNSPIEDTRNVLPDILKDGKGFEIEGNLEKFLKRKFPEAQYPQYKFPHNNKVGNSYKWASTVGIELIPSEFDVVRDFLKPDVLQSERVLEIKKTSTPDASVIITEEITEDFSDDIPF